MFADSDLISRTLILDDRNAYGELVRRHGSAVRNLLRKLTAGDWALADDLAQDTFILAYRKLGKFRGEAGFSTWLYRIATNLFLSHCRKTKRRGEISGDGSTVGGNLQKSDTKAESFDQARGPATQRGSDQSAEKRAALHMDIEKAMLSLNEFERAVVSLVYFCGLPDTRAAAMLDRPLGTIKTTLARSKEKLRSRLKAWSETG